MAPLVILLAVLPVAAFGAGHREDTPVSKVISLLEDLKSEIETEGAEEAKTYDEYACFCKDKTEEKSTSITDGQDSIDELSATVVDDTATMEKKSDELKEKKTEVEQLNKDLEEETARCLKEAADFEAELADLRKACFALEKAIESMESTGGKTMLLQLRGGVTLSKEALEAVKLGQALGLVSAPKQQAALALLQVNPDDPEYKYHSSSILELLGKLKTEFDEKKTETQSEYEKAQKICTDTKEQLEKDIEETEGEIETLEEEIDGLKTSIADARRSLVDAEAMLKDDKVYLRDLTAQCEKSANLWDQRSVARGGELEALTKALEILTEKVKDADEEANKRALIQKIARALPTTPATNASVPAFLQEVSKKVSIRSHLSEADRRAQVEQVLREMGARTNSVALMELASKARFDPFGKVKKMIQELIERLLDEARKEATKQGFCDTELGKAKQNRDHRLADVRKLAAELGVDRSKNETLAADIELLEETIPKLYESLNETTELRLEEKEENLETIKTAKGGLTAVTEAIVVLKTYYKQAAKALLQQRASPVDEDTEGPGFSGTYKGKQDSSTGIIGLLEVIKTDFDRTVRKTMAEEKQAQADFVDFERTTKTDISGKETSLELKTSEQEKVMARMNKTLLGINTTQGLLDDALKTVEDLKPMCIDFGMSYEDRVKKREEEIEALKECVKILTP